MTILIAEDDIISRRILESILRKLGHEVTACRDGSEAWDAYLQSDYPVVISDWMMPETDGLELCRRIRNENRPGYCFFIMLTARSSKADFLEAMSAGADEYMTKPLDRDEVEARLRVAQRVTAVCDPKAGTKPEIYETARSAASF